MNRKILSLLALATLFLSAGVWAQDGSQTPESQPTQDATNQPAPADSASSGASADTSSQPPTPPEWKITILHVKGKGPNLQKFLKFIEKSLSKEKIKLVGFNIYQKLAKQEKIKPKDLTLPQTVEAVGTKAQLTHVLLVEGTSEVVKIGKKNKKVSYARTLLLDAKNGTTVHEAKFTLTGVRLTPELAEQIAIDTVNKLKEIWDLTQKEAAASAQEPPPPPATPASNETTVQEEPAPAPQPEPEPTRTEPVAQTPPPEPQAPVLNGRHRPALYFHAGLIGLQRDSTLGSNTEQSPPSYASNGLLPGLMLEAELFPLAFGGDGGVVEGIGIFVDGYAIKVKSNVGENSVNSNVSSYTAGLTYRLVLGDSEISPDIRFNAGYHNYIFPLADGPFPGAAVSSPTIGVRFTLPVFEALNIFAGGHYLIGATTSGDVSHLGSKKSVGGFRGEGGFQILIQPLIVQLAGRFDQYSAKFSGNPEFAPLVLFENVKFQDRFVGGYITAGIVL